MADHDDQTRTDAQEIDRDLEAELEDIEQQLSYTEAALASEQQSARALGEERDELARRLSELERDHEAAVEARDAAARDAQELAAKVERVQVALVREQEAHAATTAALTEERSARQLVEIERDDLKERVAKLEAQLGGARRAQRAAEADASGQRSTKNFFIATTVAGAASHLLRKK